MGSYLEGAKALRAAMDAAAAALTDEQALKAAAIYPLWNSSVAYAVGDRVRHERFGDGTVLTLEGAGADAKATIRFDNIGEKKMLLKFAKIQKI